MKDQESVTLTQEPYSGALNEASHESGRQRSRRQWGVIAIVGGSVLATVLLAGACGAQDSAPTATPTSVLEPHNVPWLKIADEDRIGDGSVVDIIDLRDQYGQTWRPGLNFDFDFDVDEDDVKLIQYRIDTGIKGEIQPWDVNNDEKVNEIDVDIVRNNQGPIQDDPNPNIRNDEALQSSWSPNQILIRVGADLKDKEIKRLLERYNLGDLTNVDQHILLGDLGINLTVTIPPETLTDTGLSKLLEEVAKDAEVQLTGRVTSHRLE